jgi:dipeptidyl aminopeptidase/acylaminoacyl peptidase
VNYRSLFIPVLLAWAASAPRAARIDTADQAPAVLARALLLGPLPAGPAIPDDAIPRGTQVVVPEIVPGKRLPVDGKDGWRAVETGADGRFAVTRPGIYWVAARLRLEERTRVTLKLDHGSALYSEGDALEVMDPGHAEPVLETVVALPRGWVTVFGRVIVTEDDPGFGFTAAVDSSGAAAWTLTGAVAWSRFGDTDELAGVGGLAVADGGTYLARRINRRSDGLDRLDVFGGDGHLVAADAGGAGASPVRFLPDGSRLLMRRGNDLLVWDVAEGEPQVLLKDEPGLGMVKADAAGERILFASARGFNADAPVDGPGRRFTRMRERLPDFTPTGHLHLLDLATGTRRVLTRPGDFVLDDAVFSRDGGEIYYGRTLPIPARPWFRSEIRRIDLANGSDDLVGTFTSGWEVRPQNFVAAPVGRTLLFLGPPAEIGDYGSTGPEHNVYNKQVWELDLANGRFRRITEGETFSFDGGGGTPAFDATGRLLVRVTDGSRSRLVRLTRNGDGWTSRVLPQNGESLGVLALSPDAGSIAYTGSSPDRPGILYLAETGNAGRSVEDPNMDLMGRVAWAPAEDMSFPGPGGETIDAWFLPPLQVADDGVPRYQAPDHGKAPLIVYYYGGSAATLRGFNTTFQFLAANGYGVLVVNPRGAAGWGEAFADHHAGDWGPLAAADIMAGTEFVLAQRPWLDADAVGIFGGSYGGFMTDYLVTHTDMYAAAVSLYGISDLATYWGQGAWGVTYGDMALGGRNPWDDAAYFTQHSPLFHVGAVETPLLLLHGMADTNVTTGESVQLFTALSALDKPVEMVLFPGEDHGISGSWENRVAHQTMLLEWFDRWLRQEPSAWEARWK